MWILTSALLCGAGWVLSVLHQLNAVGYLCVFALGAAGWYWGRSSACSAANKTRAAWQSVPLCRFRRPAPFIFLATAGLALIGGAYYETLNPDTLCYRLPRVLHWLGAGQWHWIHTADSRMNLANCGFEWLTAPLILFTHSDRPVFLINWVSFLLLPGLIFSVFTRLGVRARVAWWWMWILSSGWCFVLQAGNVLTDAFIAVYALAAVDFALRARTSWKVSDAWLSMLAAALLTGAKQTAIPLALLWLIAFWPVKRLLMVRPLASAAVAAVVLLVSGSPIALFNWQHYGAWIGGTEHYELHSPVWAFLGNAFCLSAQNLLPGFFPWADAWNEWMRQFIQTPLGLHFASFEDFGHVGRAASEATAGIGAGIILLALSSWWVARGPYVRTDAARDVHPAVRWLRLAPWALLVLFMVKVGTYQNARQLAPYYIFFFPCLLLGVGQAQLVRRVAWQRFGLAVMLSGVALLVVSRDRPLLPAQAIARQLHSLWPRFQFLGQVEDAFRIRPSTSVLRRPFVGELPPGEAVLGYLTLHGAFEPGLWAPFGSRRVVRVLQRDSPAQLQARGIRYLVLEQDYCLLEDKPLEHWLAHYNAEIVRELTYVPAPRFAPNRLYLLRLKDGPTHAADHQTMAADATPRR